MKTTINSGYFISNLFDYFFSFKKNGFLFLTLIWLVGACTPPATLEENSSEQMEEVEQLAVITPELKDTIVSNISPNTMKRKDGISLDGAPERVRC